MTRRRPTLEERVERLEVGWQEAARLSSRLTKEITLLQSHIKECDASLASIVLLVAGLEQVFSAVSDQVAQS